MATRKSPWGSISDLFGQLVGPAPLCPDCGAPNNGYTAVNLGGASPQHGDIAVCAHCAAPVQYYGKPLALKRLEGDDLILARTDPLFRFAEEMVRALMRSTRT